MKDITLEKVDQIRERTGVSYEIAKEALTINKGDLLEALIYIENNVVVPFAEKEKVKDENPVITGEEVKGETVDEFKAWLKNIIEKGNVSRIKIKKDEAVLVDVPVNAGIAAAVIAVILPPVLAFGVIAAVATKITIEITRCDGSVEVVNKYVEKAASEAKGKASEFAGIVKSKINNTKFDFINKKPNKVKSHDEDETVYTYTVNFKDEE
ncbi:ubiquitin-associated domain-containing protein [Clostridium baratii]|uniref:DUF4342 domain-containing protein n=1 Tax=Clostridium baratii TaxID=1561 RepID=UPI0006C5988B|nr:DUF4342 domain-containing protein [Clostridium baratii]MDU1053873.1 DUF4342 domain-containing protein [Clostridium baratii]CUO90556.1 ubiquitin-associated domain-containing protein [Clostridium baratii]